MRAGPCARTIRLAAVAAALGPASAALAQPAFHVLTGMPGGTGGGVAYGVSADGTTVVGSAGTFEPGTWRAFRWRLDTGVVDNLGIIPAGLHGNSTARTVSADGSVVAGHTNDVVTLPGDVIEDGFRWTPQGGMVGLPELPGGSQRFRPHAVSASGSVIAGWSSGENVIAAVRWTAETGTVPLGTFPGVPFNNSHAWGIAADGSVIVGDATREGGGVVEAFRWSDAEGVVGLGTGGLRHSRAFATNSDGSVIVGSAYAAISPSRQAFRWTEETGMVLLGSLPGPTPYAVATGVSADGSVVVGNGYGGWVWTESTGMVAIADFLAQHGLSDGPYTILEVNGISADGRTLVGLAESAPGFPVAWAAVIPGPHAAGLLVLAGLAAARRRR